MNEKTICDTHQLAHKLKLFPSTVTRYASEGKIPYFRAGTHYRFFFEDVIEALTPKKK